MKKLFLFFVLSIFLFPVQAQVDFSHTIHSDKKIFKGEKRKINDLVHTDLKLKLNINEHTASGEVTLQLKPHFYPTDSLTLDAKGMEIYEVKVNDKKADYDYDGIKLRVKLPNTYTRDESYAVYVKYLSQPDKLKAPKGSAIRENKGLYFINTDGSNPSYPPQVWTQGEPESNSAWVPTIDSPNQKTTFKLELTYPGEWISLSNGEKISSKTNQDGTKTDTWKLMQPIPPYLMFFFTGPFAVVEDHYKKIPVRYYVEKKYENIAKEIFGKTPEMIKYFSTITGIEYPWNKYDQVVTREFVSGAMENVTAVNHSEMAYQTKEELVDGNDWESVIAHELFHHWFGNLVTAESWAQIAMNEAFATYGEVLWEEHDEGKDKALYKLEKDKEMYLMVPTESKKPLVRYHYGNPDEVFDLVSYQKGALIMHMLRNEVGDDAFFAALNDYLTDNRFKTGEAEQLRLSMEEISGMDLTMFFRQWFYRPGHPVLEVEYSDDKKNKKLHVKIVQKTDSLWRLPLYIHIFEEDGIRKTTRIEVADSVTRFTYPYRSGLITYFVDMEKAVASVIEEERSLETFFKQYEYGLHYFDRKAGLNEAIENKDKKEAFAIIVKALDDPFYKLRIKAIEALDVESTLFNGRVEKKLYRIARQDPKTLVRAAAIEKLGKLKKRKYLKWFEKALKSPSAAVKRAGFVALLYTDKNKAKGILSKLSEDEKKSLGLELLGFYVDENMTEEMPYVAEHILDDMMAIFSGEGRKIYEKASQWITTSDHLKANRIFADRWYETANQLKQYGLKGMVLMMMHSFINNQKQNEGKNKEEIIRYYKETIQKVKAL